MDRVDVEDGEFLPDIHAEDDCQSVLPREKVHTMGGTILQMDMSSPRMCEPPAEGEGLAQEHVDSLTLPASPYPPISCEHATQVVAVGHELEARPIQPGSPRAGALAYDGTHSPHGAATHDTPLAEEG